MIKRGVVSFILMLCILFISGAGAVWSAPDSQAARTTIRLGVMIRQNTDADLGLQLAVEELNDFYDNRTDDIIRFRYELLYPRNYPNQPEEVRNALDEFVTNQEVSAIIAPSDGDLMLANLEPFARAGVPVLTLSTVEGLTDFDVTNNIMRFQAAESYQSAAAANYMINDLGLTNIALVQTNIQVTESLVAYELEMNALGLTPEIKVQLEDNTTLAENADALATVQPEAVAMWGSIEDAVILLETMRQSGWQGVFFYHKAQEAILSGRIPTNLQAGLLGVAGWSYGLSTTSSRQFLLDFVTTYGRLPSAEAAAMYDAVLVLDGQIRALGSPAMPALYQSLREMPSVLSVQGDLSPVEFGNGDFSRSVVVYEISERGGVSVLAQYRNGVRLEGDALANDDVNLLAAVGTATFTPTPSDTPTATPTITPTPSQVQLTVVGGAIEVRTGPGDFYESIGELQVGSIVTIIGGDADLQWYVVQYRGGIAWIPNFANLIDIFDPGNLLFQLPIINPPPTPLGGVTATPVTELADIVIDTVVLEPAQPQPGVPFTAFVTVRNAGNAPTAPFTIATTFEPGSVFSSNVVPTLGVGSSFVIPLTATLSSSGDFSANIAADVNNEVQEGEEGEQNNFYTLTYRVDFGVVNQLANFELFAGDALDLAGGLADLQWSGSILDGINGATVGIVTGLTYEQVGYSNLDPVFLNQANVADTQIFPGVLIGVVTAEGQRAVVRVEGRVGTTLSISFKVYGG